MAPQAHQILRFLSLCVPAAAGSHFQKSQRNKVHHGGSIETDNFEVSPSIKLPVTWMLSLVVESLSNGLWNKILVLSEVLLEGGEPFMWNFLGPWEYLYHKAVLMKPLEFLPGDGCKSPSLTPTFGASWIVIWSFLWAHAIIAVHHLPSVMGQLPAPAICPGLLHHVFGTLNLQTCELHTSFSFISSSCQVFHCSVGKLNNIQ